jgi:hypothetical protein
VANAGGIVTVSATIDGSDIESITDGFEHDFSGAEWFGNSSQFISNTTDSAAIAVTYDQEVPIHTVRLIEGYDQSGFSKIDVEILISDHWEKTSFMMARGREINSAQPLQILDMILTSPIIGRGIRVSGPVNDHLNILELDALDDPPERTGNIPPIVKIVTPVSGESFLIPSDITIEAEASDADGTINNIEFYSGSTYLGTDNTVPYSITVNDMSPGYYRFIAKATDDRSAISYSDEIWITVTDSTVGGEIVWHSYDISTTTGSQPVIVFDENGLFPAYIELYVSSNDFGVDKGNFFSIFNAGHHPENFNKVEDFWSVSSRYNAYPYAGKSIIERGSDSGEDTIPYPQGVFDLQLHPPESDKLIVASFIIPAEGDYQIFDCAVRRVHHEGNIINYYVFNHLKELLFNLQATNNQRWVRNTNTFRLDNLPAGNRIYFAIGRGLNDNYYWDATEIIWTIKKLDPEKDYTPDKHILFQNYPNPFNTSTMINYQLSKTSYTELSIYNLLGQKVVTLVADKKEAGNHQVEWNATGFASGLYYYRIQTDEFQDVKKMLLLR